MAGSKTGTASIVKLAGRINHLYSTYGAADLATRTSSDFATCVTGLVACYNVLRATDDLLLQIDRTPPYGPEDLPIP